VTAPQVLILAGPNGAGKTTVSRAVIADSLGIAEFVNADIIAQGLSGFDPEHAALSAGRIMLTRLKELAAARHNFAFETTLASRTFAPWLADLVQSGYEFNLIFVWLSAPSLAVQRMHVRVRKGGHFVPPDIVRRRYRRGIANFIHLYTPIATRWHVYDNSGSAGPVEIAARKTSQAPAVYDSHAWAKLMRTANAEDQQDNR
jgi:predicted ABC-type ATPase